MSKKEEYIKHLENMLKHDGYSPDYDNMPVIPLKEPYRTDIKRILKEKRLELKEDEN